MVRVPVRIVGRDLPGLRFEHCYPVHVALRRGSGVEDHVPGDAESVVFELYVDVRPDRAGNLDYRGPYVSDGAGKGDRSVGLAWGTVAGAGEFELFRAAKLRLPPIDVATLDRVAEAGLVLQATVDLTDDRGGPVCARVPDSMLRWDYVPADRSDAARAAPDLTRGSDRHPAEADPGCVDRR
ncbi:MAG: DUF5990 family protein [Sporichthyaceae bacterium]|nr:DUF5990 family protein [Sporichthyaceae bacterium]